MEEYSISQIHEMIKSGSLTAQDLIRRYLDRIQKIDKNGPKLNSIIEINPDAIDIAHNLDQYYNQNGLKGKLHGIPVIIKDNIDTSDKMMTTAGSLALEGSIAQKDSFIVTRLRDEGAIILGKANLSEWANFRGQRSTSGWSSRGGRTKNPHVLDRNPCGSSSGSAVSVAANLCVVSIGTETDGSIVCPASSNGIVGIKPTIGLVSRTGLIPIAHSQDTAGPMARNVEDAAILLNSIAGKDERDQTTQYANDFLEDYTKYLDKDGLKDMRVGILGKFLGNNPKLKPIVDRSLDVLKNTGADIIENIEIESPEGLGPAELNVLLYEYKQDLNKYLAELPPEAKVHSIEDVIKFNEDNSDKVLPYFGHEHMVNALGKGDLESEEYKEAIALYAKLRENFDHIMQENDFDVLFALTRGPAWLTDLINGDSAGSSVSTSFIAAITGYCNITVPAGFVNELPVGVSFISGAYQEPKIIKAAYAFEQAINARKSPRFIETINPQI